MKGIEFMGKSYASQKSFTAYINERLSKLYGFIEQGDDYEFIHELYKRHPHYNSTIDKFHISQLAQGGQDVSRVHNGMYDKFSKYTCIRQQLFSEEHYTKSLARELVRDQIKTIRRTLCDTCELCQSTSNLEVDHHPVLFSKILRDFGPLSISLNQETNKYETEQANAWMEFHHTHAKYRLLCGTCNKSEYWKVRTEK